MVKNIDQYYLLIHLIKICSLEKLNYQNQIDIEVVDQNNNPLRWRKFHLELALK